MHWSILLLVAGLLLLLMVLFVLFEPNRQRRVLATLRSRGTWMPGAEIRTEARVSAVYVTLTNLEDVGLVEREEQTVHRDAPPITFFRLTDKGREAAERRTSTRAS